MTETPTPPAGWYADPTERGTQRYWDGSAWTEHVQRATPVTRVETKHKFGLGGGKLVDMGEGTAVYSCMSVSPPAYFKVRIADITGFSVTRADGGMRQTFNVLGNGTTLASVVVNAGVGEKLEQWFRAHPHFAQSTIPGAEHAPAATAQASDLADQLTKLSALREQGLLTDDEFVAMKAKLIG